MDSRKEALRVGYNTKIQELEYDRRKYPFETAACYGMGAIIRRMALYPANWPLTVDTDHGPSQRDEPTYLEFRSKAPLMLYHSRRLLSVWNQKSSTRAAGYFSPFVFYRRKFRMNRKIDSQGTLAFPAHSTELIDVSFSQQEYIKQLLALPQKFHPIDICMYYKDINRGYHRQFLDSGFNVYCAGHVYDERFVRNFYNLLCEYNFATSNSVGSYLFYSVEANVPFFIYGPSPIMLNSGDPNSVEGAYDPHDMYKQMKKAYKLFTPTALEQVSISPAQKTFVFEELGLNFKIGTLMFNIYKAWAIHTSAGFFSRKYRQLGAIKLRAKDALRNFKY